MAAVLGRGPVAAPLRGEDILVVVVKMDRILAGGIAVRGEPDHIVAVEIHLNVVLAQLQLAGRHRDVDIVIVQQLFAVLGEQIDPDGRAAAGLAGVQVECDLGVSGAPAVPTAGHKRFVFDLILDGEQLIRVVLFRIDDAPARDERQGAGPLRKRLLRNGKIL